MDPVIISVLMSFLSGVIGTGMGGMITAVWPHPSPKTMSFALAFAGGIMFSVVAFDVMPASFSKGSLWICLLGLTSGLAMMLAVDLIVPSESNRLRREGLIIASGIGLHNFAEGLAIGSGYVAEAGLGIGVAIVMAIHDIPEGMALAVPLRMGGMRRRNLVFAALAAGLPTAVGGMLGGLLGIISDGVLSICLALAGGAMLSIVAEQLLPDAKEASKGKSSSIGFWVGTVTGIMLAKML